MLDTLRSAFEQQFGDAHGVRMAMAPGRVNLIGDHTDYNDGYVLPMTVDRGIYLALRRRDDATVRLYSVRYDERVEYPLDRYPALLQPGSWLSYVAGVVEELRRRGLVSVGFEGVVDGDLLPGSGLGSSAALEVATAMALQQLLGFSLNAVDTVRLCQRVEHHYANVLCGIMDQFASRLGRRNHALFLDCRSLDYWDIPLALGDYRVVIVESGVKRSLAASAYNTRTAECRQAVEYFKKFDSAVHALRDVTEEMVQEHGHGLPVTVQRRCRHVVSENERVVRAADLLSDGDLEPFGGLMHESHRSLNEDYEVSCAELDTLVDIAMGTDGVLGARMTGAGFGGCTVNLAHSDAIPALLERIDADYAHRFSLEPRFFALQGNLEAGPVPTTEK